MGGAEDGRGPDPVVQGLDAAVYVVPTDAPEADGTLAWDKTTLVLVTARAGGQQGIGWSYTAAAAARRWSTGILSGVVTGRSALDVPGANEAMARALRNMGRPGIGAMALSAADIALWDLKARLLGCAVAGLAGRARDDVPIYGSGGFTTYDEARTREQLTGWVDKDRIPRVKIKIGESWGGDERRDLSRVALAREVIGPDTELYVDANGGYSTGQAVRMARQMDELRGHLVRGAGVLPGPGGPGGDPAAGPARRDSGRVQLVAGGFRPPAGRRGGGLPAARRDPVRRYHRVPARRRAGRRAQRAGLRALRAEPARPGRRWPCPTCGTWNTFMTINGSSGCSSTGPWTRREAC